MAWYSGLALQGAEVDGQPVTPATVRELGWWVHSTTVAVPPGGTATVVLRLAGPLGGAGPYRLAVAPQAAARDDRYRVEVTGGAGWVAGPVRQPRPGRSDALTVTLRRN